MMQDESKEDSDRLKDNLNLSINNSDISNGDNDKTVLEKDSSVHQNEIWMKNEFPASSSSPVQSSVVKSAELQQVTISCLQCDIRKMLDKLSELIMYGLLECRRVILRKIVELMMMILIKIQYHLELW